MPLKIVNFSVTLNQPQVPVELQVPLDGQDLAMRVHCRYLPNQVPPPPEIVLIVGVQDPPVEVTAEGAPKQVTRSFELWPRLMDLPLNFKKYIATVPFGADKTQYDLIEVG